MTTLKNFALFFGLALGLTACGEVEEFIDCRDICTDYEACAGDGYDVSECVDRCEDQPQGEIDECDACLDSEGMTCSDCSLACAPLAF